jgi:hypothetical protein
MLDIGSCPPFFKKRCEEEVICFVQRNRLPISLESLWLNTPIYDMVQSCALYVLWLIVAVINLFVVQLIVS